MNAVSLDTTGNQEHNMKFTEINFVCLFTNVTANLFWFCYKKLSSVAVSWKGASCNEDPIIKFVWNLSYNHKENFNTRFHSHCMTV